MDLLSAQVKCLIICFEGVLSKPTRGALLVSKENPFVFYDPLDQVLSNLSDLPINTVFLRKLMRYCHHNKIIFCLVSLSDDDLDSRERRAEITKLKLAGCEILSGRQMIFKIVNAVITNEDMHYLNNGFDMFIYNGRPGEVKNKNHLISEVIKDKQILPSQIMYIDTDIQSTLDAMLEWDGDNGIKTLHVNNEFNLEKYGYLIGEKVDPVMII